jgi:hypothetical protein
MKRVELVKNHAGGIDLMVDRDAGNGVCILTGKPECSKDFWNRLREKCDIAIDELDI